MPGRVLLARLQVISAPAAALFMAWKCRTIVATTLFWLLRQQQHNDNNSAALLAAAVLSLDAADERSL